MFRNFALRTLTLATVTAAVIGSAGFAQADVQPIGAKLNIQPENLTFEFGSQDGDYTIPCTHKIVNAMLNDWEISCNEPGSKSPPRVYTLHLVVKLYVRNQAPKLTYEILHWLTDHQIEPAKVGRYVGSTVRFRLNEPTALHSFDLAQDFENVNVLRMTLRVK